MGSPRLTAEVVVDPSQKCTYSLCKLKPFNVPTVPIHHMITIWSLNNMVTFVAICSIPCSHNHDLQCCCFLPETSIHFWFPAEKPPIVDIGFSKRLQFHLITMVICLMSATKKWVDHVMLTTSWTYNCSSGFYHNCKLRTISVMNIRE